MQDLAKILAEYDIAFMKLQLTVVLLNSATSFGKFLGDFEVAKCEVARNKALADYQKLLSRRFV